MGFSPAATLTVRGNVTLRSLEAVSAAALVDTQACSGREHHSSLVRGAQVKITNASSQVVGVGTLSGGNIGPDNGPAGRCYFTFKASVVDSMSAFYGVTIGTEPEQQVPAAQMKAGPSIKLGDGS